MRFTATSIPNFKEIENWENDAIFCNPLLPLAATGCVCRSPLTAASILPIGVSKNGIVFAYRQAWRPAAASGN
jgi:hypothetical protein